LTPVPPVYLIRAINEFFTAAGDALFTAKEARCFPETAIGFVCLPSERSWRGRKDQGFCTVRGFQEGQPSALI